MGQAAFADQILTASFASPYADDARYLPEGGGAAVTGLRVIMGGMEDGLDMSGLSAHPVVANPSVEVMRLALAAPSQGGVFEILDVDGVTVLRRVQIITAPILADPARRVWTCQCVEKTV